MRRLIAVIAAVLVNVAIWVAVEVVGGVDLKQPGFGDRPATDLGGLQVALSTAVATLLGWALLVILERVNRRRAGTIWTVVAVAFTLLSIGSPLAGTGITTGNRLTLVAMHVAAALTFIPLVRRTVRAREMSNA
jgi:hypothetical protein